LTAPFESKGGWGGMPSVKTDPARPDPPIG